MFLFISGPEIGFVIFIVVLLFGADKIPEFARGLGKGINNIKHATNEIKHEIKTSKDKINKDSNVSVQIKSEIEKVKSEIDSVTDSVKRDL
ncbi:MAG: twin-arginine translocase TatA/TatE family subunit [Flavobacteriaceae bacterium]|nr:twin-arginine translocase TatA/TatE family subunit [Flavobacteriaceae bacterium]